MALFKIKQGESNNLPNITTAGVMYLCLDDGRLYVDIESGKEPKIGNGTNGLDGINRICINDFIQRTQEDYILYDGGNAFTTEYDIYLDGGNTMQ